MSVIQHQKRASMGRPTSRTWTPADFDVPIMAGGERYLRRDEAVALVQQVTGLNDAHAYNRLIYWARTMLIRCVGVNVRSFVYHEGDLREVLSDFTA